MNRPLVNQRYALSVAATLQKLLREKHVPVREVLVFGSAARNRTHEWSDIDIAVICDPFLASKFDEQQLCSREARTIDVRSEVVCLHRGDLENKYFTLAKEVQRHGIVVSEK